jgi:cytochrome P450
VLHTTRSTKTRQVLTKGSHTYVVPANALIYINNSALHTNPETWGADSLEFRPTRWLAQDSTSSDVFVTLPRGRFIPWSGGPRVCPGQKMSQVEFVAVIATIFKRYTVAAVLEKGETVEAARERLRGVMLDSQPRLTLQMNKPHEVKLKWSRR